MRVRAFALSLLCGAALAGLAFTNVAAAQGGIVLSRIVLSRADAIRMATTRAPRAALARADAAAAGAGLSLARQFENPTLSASYSKSDPKAHFALDIPLDLPRVRSARIAAAERDVGAAAARLQFGLALLELDVDTSYTRAQALAARAVLSLRTARDADRLLEVARLRRDAGDASDLDVELAEVFAGQSINAAIGDSLAAAAGRVSLALLLGLAADSVRIALGDSISLADSSATADSVASRIDVSGGAHLGTSQAAANAQPLLPGELSLPVTAAMRDVEAAGYRLLVEQRRRLAAPSLSVGFEAADPGNNGLLPTVGVALPLPFFNRNQGAIRVAQAELDRVRASLLVARAEQAAAVVNASRDAAAAAARLARSRALVSRGNRIAALSLVAYREGAAPLATVLEAQRSARETLAQYVDDMASAQIAASVLRFFSLSPTTPR